MSRKQIFANLRTPDAAADERRPDQNETIRRPSRIRPLMGSPDLIEGDGRSPIGSIGQSLGELSEKSRRADEIEKKLLSGQTMVELDPAIIEPSFVPDRMVDDDETFESFVEAIEQEGQQVPILVRPHPEIPEKYQVAFGHRRLRAAQKLGRPVKAIVRQMSDRDLVVAQGQENNERQDTSYIEKARFAQRLEQRFPRDVISAALSVFASNLSNMLSVAAKIPEDLVEAIGPAHGVGRRNWMSLADRLASDKQALAKARSLSETPEFKDLPSTERFEALTKALKSKPRGNAADPIVSHDGTELGRIHRNKLRMTLTINPRTTPEFADFVANELPRLFDEHRKSRQANP